MTDGLQDLLKVGRQAMLAESAAIELAAERLDASFNEVLQIILSSKSKLVVCGIGKSGHIGSKLAATFSSGGVPAVFLHAAEAIHGDLGVYQPGDPTIVLSKSGSTAEILRLLPMFRKFKSPVIAIVGNMSSAIADAADVVLDASVEREVDPLNLMPTSSSTVTLAIGDAIAAALVKAKGFTKEDFATYHPGGQLGRNLLMTVGDVMHGFEKVACVGPQQSIREVVMEMTRYPLGAACVLEEGRRLIGIITDGDIRRLLCREGDILNFRVGDYMTDHPISAVPSALLGDALRLMEDRASQISVLPVVGDATNTLVGLLRIHDAYLPGLS